MIAPVLLLGSGAWWLSSGGKIPRVSHPLDPGPLRVEYTPFQRVQSSPYQAWQGYEWGVTTQVSVLGEWKMPPGWKSQGHGNHDDAWIVVKRKGLWEKLPASRKIISRDYSAPSGMKLIDDKYTFWVNTQLLPRDAQEVRLRGHLQVQPAFSGRIPSGWTPPKNMIVRGPYRWLTVQSKPFDIQIKAPNEPFPKPAVSRVTPLQFVDAKWIVDQGSNYFVFQVRRTDGKEWKLDRAMSRGHSVILDEKGRPLPPDGEVHNFHQPPQDWFSRKRADADRIVEVGSVNVSGHKAFKTNIKGPLHLRTQVSDGECWPLSIDVKVPRVEMKLKDFGAAK